MGGVCQLLWYLPMGFHYRHKGRAWAIKNFKIYYPAAVGDLAHPVIFLFAISLRVWDRRDSAINNDNKDITIQRIKIDFLLYRSYRYIAAIVKNILPLYTTMHLLF